MDLSYFNARVRGLMGRLAGKADYDALLKAEGVAQYIDRLKATSYGPYIEAASTRFERPEEALDEALGSGLSDTFGLVWRLSPDEAKYLLRPVISAWEVYDLKTVLRGIAKGVRRDDIMRALIPAGEFDRASLSLLLGSKDVHDAVRFLSTWQSPYAAPLRKGLGAFISRGDIIEMELNLDIFVNGYFISGLGRSSGDRAIREVMALRADIGNVMTLLKTSGAGYSKEGLSGFFIEGGQRLSRKVFTSLSGAGERGEALKRLSMGLRDGALKRALAQADPDELYVLEEDLEDIIAGRLLRMSVTEPLSIALPAAFIYMKAREVKNLRLIWSFKSFGLPEDELKRLLFYKH